MNKSSSLLLHLHLHLLHFLIMNKSSYFKKKKKSILSKSFQKRKRKFSKKAWGLGALGSYFLGCFQKKKNQNFQFQEKIQDFQIFSKKQKKSSIKFSIPSKNSKKKKFRISKFFKKKKKKTTKDQNFQKKKKKEEGNFQKRP